jgi:hypothetical protein
MVIGLPKPQGLQWHRSDEVNRIMKKHGSFSRTASWLGELEEWLHPSDVQIDPHPEEPIEHSDYGWQL